MAQNFVKAEPPPFCDPKDDDCCSKDDEMSCCSSEMNERGKLKASCEKCSIAKVKCSGEIPCERCSRKGLECEYKMEKKRGRRTAVKTKKMVCSDASCWGQVVMNPINKLEDFGAKFGLESTERRIFQTFFAIYKHHATPQSCCREWFTYQLNKMSTFLLSNGNRAGQEKLDAWMRKKGIEVTVHDPREFAKVPANMYDSVTGQKFPPINPMKGPRMGLDDLSYLKRKRNRGSGQVYTTKGFYRDDIKNSPVDKEIQLIKTSAAFLNLRATHERFEVEVNEEFSALFGYTSRDVIIILERLFGGLLPWGCDALAMLLANDHDLLFFIRILAMKFNNVGRPAKFPATRQAMSTHMFDFENKNGDIIECVLKCVHREYLSMERTEVDIYYGFDPVIPDTPRAFRGMPLEANKRLVSCAGQDSSIAVGAPQAVAFPPSQPMYSQPFVPAQEKPPGQFVMPATTAPAFSQPVNTFDSEETFDDNQWEGSTSPQSQVDGNGQYNNQGATGEPNGEDFPSESNLEGLDFLDSIMNWAEDDKSGRTHPPVRPNPFQPSPAFDVAEPLGNMSIGSLSIVSDNFAPSDDDDNF